MNKKIEDAANKYCDKTVIFFDDQEKLDGSNVIAVLTKEAFKAGAKFALNEGIAFCNEGIDFMNNKDTGCVNDKIEYAKNRSALQIYKNVKYQLKQLLLKEGN